MGELFPSKAIKQSSSHNRYVSIPTPNDVKSHLFGIPLQSTLTGETLTDEIINKKIKASISWLEHELDIYISPVQFTERHDWIVQHWTANNGFIKLSHPNVLSVDKVEFRFTNDEITDKNIFRIPDQMIYFEPKDGTIRLVPATSVTFTGWLYSAMGGYMISMLITKGRIPGAIHVTYTVGFEEDKIPALIADIVELHAALELLSMLSVILFPYGSHSVSQDGLSHSVSTPGPSFLNNRIAQLSERLNSLLDSARQAYTRKYILDWM